MNLISEVFRSCAVCCEYCGRPLPHDEIRCAQEQARRMSRRHFFGLGLGAASALVAPAAGFEVELRTTTGDLWTAWLESYTSNLAITFAGHEYRFDQRISERDYRVPFTFVRHPPS